MPAIHRIAALYDIHGNLPALEAVLDQVRRERVDAVVVGGDVLPGPMPRESLAALRALECPVHYIRGNGDREVVSQYRGTVSPWFERAREEWRIPVRWTAQQLSAQEAELIATWPLTVTLEVARLGSVLFCHGTPRDDNECFTRLTPEAALLPIMRAAGADIVVCGHTHMQFDRMVGNIRVVNAGSIGMPFGPAGADWLLLGPDVELRHTDYDLEAAAARVRATSYPQAEEFAERSILHPPAAEPMLEAFTKAGLK
jgi:putative phosphoesterase